MSLNQTKARSGGDIGGTFTDVVLEHGDQLYTLKLLTQLEAPENGVREGVSRVLDQASLTYQDVGLVINGTTLATNVMIERRRAGVDGLIIEIEHSKGAPFAVLPCSTALNIQHEVAMVALPGGRGGPICQAYLS